MVYFLKFKTKEDYLNKKEEIEQIDDMVVSYVEEDLDTYLKKTI